MMKILWLKTVIITIGFFVFPLPYQRINYLNLTFNFSPWLVVREKPGQSSQLAPEPSGPISLAGRASLVMQLNFLTSK